MPRPAPTWSSERSAALAYLWGAYRTWAATARAQKAELSTWRFRVLVLTTAGALLATLSHEFTRWGLGNDTWRSLPALLGVLGGISLALATYFGREILRPECERRWVRARSMAEALKREVYLFRTGVPPYDGPDAATGAVERARELLESVDDLQAETLSEEQRQEGLPTGPLSVDEYVQERVEDQVDRFYRPRAQEYGAVVKRARRLSLWLGALAAILGVLGATGWTAAWVAVITTILAAVTSYLYAGRYQYLIVSYQATARQLDALQTQWKVSGRTGADLAERNRFILACEEAISIENDAWMAKWTEEETGTVKT